LYLCNNIATYKLAYFSRYTPIADKLGIVSALVCAVHCLVIPAIFLLKYTWADTTGVAAGNSGWGSGLPHWWELLDYVFLIVGFIAVYHAANHTGKRPIKISLWFFWLCLAVAVVFEQQLHWMAYIASAGLIITHFFNIRLHQKSTTKKHDK